MIALQHIGRKKRGMVGSRKPSAEEEDRVVIESGVTAGKRRRFRTALCSWFIIRFSKTAPAAPIEMRKVFVLCFRALMVFGREPTMFLFLFVSVEKPTINNSALLTVINSSCYPF